ncbi:hypothetical protein RSAG8_00514, partial [Rhizoctonia solani AG-8 WAC10335]
MEAQLSAQDKPEKEPILVVATGGSSGLGLEALATYLKQSENDIILVLGCRNPANPLVSTQLGGFQNIRKLDIFELELTSNDSIRGFASHILEVYPQQSYRAPSLCRRRLLLECLWPRLVGPAGGMVCSRVVFVASSLHKKASLQHEVSPSSIDILLNNNPWKPMSAYSISKLAQMHLFKIVEDAFAKVEDSKSRPTAIAVSPGFVPQTGLARESSWLTRQVMAYVMPLFPFTTSLEEGGKTIARAMIAQNLQSGTYIMRLLYANSFR